MENNLLKTFENAEQYFAIIDRYNGLIEDYKKNSNFQREKYWFLKNQKKPSPAMTLPVFLGGFFGLVLIENFIMQSNRALYNEDFVKSALILSFFFAFVLALVYAIICISKRKKINNQAENFWNNEGLEITQKNNEKIKEITVALNDFIDENTDISAKIPPDYRNFPATSYMANAIRNCRANTLKEAINLYEEELHKMKMLDNQMKTNNQIYDLCIMQAKMNSEIKSMQRLQMFDTMGK